MRTGTSRRAFRPPFRGLNFLRSKKEGVSPFRAWCVRGNLRNGSNAGLSYVNGRNALSNANWNIAP